MKIERDHLIFSTGKRLYAHWETIGIKLSDDDDGSIGLSYGGDGSIYLPEDEYMTNERLTPEECTELADVMIARWQEFKDRYK